MSSIQDRMHAEKWLDLAISKHKLADFVIGLPPYAKVRPEQGPVLVPNLEVLYDCHEEHPERGFDRDVENAVIQIVEASGENAQVVLHALVFVATHLAYEKRGAAKFSLNCPKLLDAIRKQVSGHKKEWQKQSDDVWRSIVFYDSLLREQHGLHLL